MDAVRVDRVNLDIWVQIRYAILSRKKGTEKPYFNAALALCSQRSETEQDENIRNLDAI